MKKSKLVDFIPFILLLFIVTYFSLRLIIEPFLSREYFVVLYAILTIVTLYFLINKYGFKNTDILLIIYCISLFNRFMIQMLCDSVNFFTLISLFQYLFPVLFAFIGRYIRKNYYINFETLAVFLILLSIGFGLLNYQFKLIPEFFYETDRTIVSGIVVNRAGSLMGPSLTTGGLCGIGLAFIFKNNHIPIALRILGYIIMTLSVIMTYSRGALICFITIFFILCFFEFKKFSNRKKLNLFISGYAFLVLIIITLLLMAFYKIANVDIYIQRYVFDLFSKKEAGNSIRLQVMLEALKLIIEKPILGIGFGHLGSSAVERGIPGSFSPENYYLKLGAEAGIFNLLLFLCLVFYTLYQFRNNNLPEKNKYVGIVLGFLLWSLFLQILENDFFSIIFWYSLGRLQSYNVEKQVENNENLIHNARGLGMD